MDGRYATYEMNADGLTTAYLYDIGVRQDARCRCRLGLTRSSAGTPMPFHRTANRCCLVIRVRSGLRFLGLRPRLRQAASGYLLGRCQPQSQRPAGRPKLSLYKSFDGKTISAFLWMPFNLKRDGSNPAVVLPHGGPTGQTVATFSATAAALVFSWIHLHRA